MSCSPPAVALRSELLERLVFVLLQADCPFVGPLGAGACATVDLHELRIAVKKPATEQQAWCLEQEVAAMAATDHPAIPNVHCWIEPEHGGPRCLGMQYISGSTLDSWLWCVLITCCVLTVK